MFVFFLTALKTLLQESQIKIENVQKEKEGK